MNKNKGNITANQPITKFSLIQGYTSEIHALTNTATLYVDKEPYAVLHTSIPNEDIVRINTLSRVILDLLRLEGGYTITKHIPH